MLHFVVIVFFLLGQFGVSATNVIAQSCGVAPATVSVPNGCAPDATYANGCPSNYIDKVVSGGCYEFQGGCYYDRPDQVQCIGNPVNQTCTENLYNGGRDTCSGNLTPTPGGSGVCSGTRGNCSGSCGAGETCEAPFNPQNGDACACRGAGECVRGGSQCVAPFVARPDPQGTERCMINECTCDYPNVYGGDCTTAGGSRGLICAPMLCCNPSLPLGTVGSCPDNLGHCVNPSVPGATPTHYNCYASVTGWTAMDTQGWNWWCLAAGHSGGGQPGDVLCHQSRCPVGYTVVVGNTWVSGAPNPDTNFCDRDSRCGTYGYEFDNGDSKWGLRCSCQGITCQLTNTPPTFDSITVTNDVGTTLTASNNRHHICQQTVSQSAHPRRMIFLINASDTQGGGDITAMTLTWNGHNLPVTLQPAVGNSRTGIATVDFPEAWNNSGTFTLNVVITDTYNETASNNGRSLKVWNCNVPVSGSMYDSSDSAFGAVCATGVGFNTLASASMNFTSVNVGSTVWTASGGNAYAGGNLTFSYTYTLTPNADLMGSGIITRWIDLNVGTTSCGAAQTLNSGAVDPFAVTPRMRVDFSAIRSQEAWFQTKGGGIQASNSVANMVPITCANNSGSCTPATSIESSPGAGNNGLVSAGTITNNSGCGNGCGWGNPNNWSRNYSTLSTMERYGYSYFYDRYFSTLGLGITLPSPATMSQVLASGGTGVFLINGDFNVDVNNTLVGNSFLMIVAKGTITFATDVTSSAGIFIGDTAIGTSPGTNNALTINGILFSPSGNVRLNRGFANKLNNNTKPAVVVNYRPDLVFNMPGLLFRILSNWKQF